MEKNIETLATALYVKIDDMLLAGPGLAPWRPEGCMPATLSDAEVLAMAVMSALPGFRSERRWLRYASAHLGCLFPRQIGQSGYNKRLRKMISLLMTVIRRLGTDTTLWTDDVWIVDSTPVQCGCSRETVTRSDVAGWARYGYCASHSRYFWGLRLHLVCTLHGLPVMFAIAGAKADEREVLLAMLEIDAALVDSRPGQTLIGDKNYFGRDFEKAVAGSDLALLRPVRKGEPRRAGQQFPKPLRQVIESVNQTLKAQLDLEGHGGRTEEGILARILYRLLALTAAIWHNDKTGQEVKRSLIAYDH
ncbi:MAG TPA: IS982 family transposase [Streptosporangiaceae bacterium]|nr:IS982 family transposase [Streptosporangiaceae bacterium]